MINSQAKKTQPEYQNSSLSQEKNPISKSSHSELRKVLASQTNSIPKSIYFQKDQNRQNSYEKGQNLENKLAQSISLKIQTIQYSENNKLRQEIKEQRKKNQGLNFKLSSYKQKIEKYKTALNIKNQKEKELEAAYQEIAKKLKKQITASASIVRSNIQPNQNLASSSPICMCKKNTNSSIPKEIELFQKQIQCLLNKNQELERLLFEKKIVNGVDEQKRQFVNQKEIEKAEEKDFEQEYKELKIMNRVYEEDVLRLSHEIQEEKSKNELLERNRHQIKDKNVELEQKISKMERSLKETIVWNATLQEQNCSLKQQIQMEVKLREDCNKEEDIRSLGSSKQSESVDQKGFPSEELIEKEQDHPNQDKFVDYSGEAEHYVNPILPSRNSLKKSNSDELLSKQVQQVQNSPNKQENENSDVFSDAVSEQPQIQSNLKLLKSFEDDTPPKEERLSALRNSERESFYSIDEKHQNQQLQESWHKEIDGINIKNQLHGKNGLHGLNEAFSQNQNSNQFFDEEAESIYQRKSIASELLALKDQLEDYSIKIKRMKKDIQERDAQLEKEKLQRKEHIAKMQKEFDQTIKLLSCKQIPEESFKVTHQKKAWMQNIDQSKYAGEIEEIQKIQNIEERIEELLRSEKVLTEKLNRAEKKVNDKQLYIYELKEKRRELEQSIHERDLSIKHLEEIREVLEIENFELKGKVSVKDIASSILQINSIKKSGFKSNFSQNSLGRTANRMVESKMISNFETETQPVASHSQEQQLSKVEECDLYKSCLVNAIKSIKDYLLEGLEICIWDDIFLLPLPTLPSKVQQLLQLSIELYVKRLKNIQQIEKQKNNNSLPNTPLLNSSSSKRKNQLSMQDLLEKENEELTRINREYEQKNNSRREECLTLRKIIDEKQMVIQELLEKLNRYEKKMLEEELKEKEKKEEKKRSTSKNIENSEAVNGELFFDFSNKKQFNNLYATKDDENKMLKKQLQEAKNREELRMKKKNKRRIIMIDH